MKFWRAPFHKAADWLMNPDEKRRLPRFVATQIIESQKFVVPDAGKMLTGTEYVSLFEVMKLPYPKVSLLREISLDGKVLQQICIGIEGQSFYPEHRANFWVCDALNILGMDAWICSSPVGFEILQGTGEIQTYRYCEFESEEIATNGVLAENQKGPLSALTELMLMLSLQNVSTVTINPPAALNKKRQKRGNLPLYSYHLLSINGQTIGGDEPGSKSDLKIRSHFRRGHIRRLHDQRKIWVSATFVRGSAAGFVDKDYVHE